MESSRRLDGKGQVNLPARKLKIKLNARIIQDLATLDNACRTPRKMMEVDWPITCKGSFDDDPAKLCGISADDMASIAVQLTRGKLQNNLLKGIGKLFGNDKN